MILALQNTILEMIAKGEPLAITVEQLCVNVEAAVPGITASVLTFDGSHLHPLAAPSLPSDYSAALDHLEAGPLAGSCGTAAYRGEPVIVTDIATDPLWENFKALALPLGLKACWSTPIRNAIGVVGTFAFYYRELRGPTEVEQKIVEACVHLCSIAIDRNERVLERERLTYTDALTGLPNRACFNQLIADGAGPLLGPWGILLADIDNLKQTNDIFGHAAGDALIKVVAERIATAAATAQTFRLSGDEFAVIVDGSAPADLAAIADVILPALTAPSLCDGHVIYPSATLGGALAKAGCDPEEVRQQADVALYHAKECSRGRYIQYTPELGTAQTHRFRAIRDVRLALAEDRLDAYYQPIVRLDTGDIVGFEALCRMRSPSGEIIAAKNFHEATKDAKLAVDLTNQMLLRVARDIRSWLDDGQPLQHVGVNLSAVDLQAGGLRQRLTEIFERADVPLHHLILEVTESVYLDQRDHRIASEIDALRKVGIRVALDEFGTGYASLTHLLTFPVDIIKIDKSFTDRLVPGDAGLIIIEGLLGIANNLGLKVVAEGIETQLQADQLLQLGCKLGQGYLYSRAVDRCAATTLLRRHGQRLCVRSPDTKASDSGTLQA
ncbi:putative bifunctional diguanylate cyclase/phosphodiesterase [Rhizobium halophilum]|uniref:putative bifunctional diguanylate cyclase/phosphodiesterase n=1 Tax=Rhizobium halophilum TaxID=2846852 RepID=UPI001EFE0EDD|nr:EAL domain-containing protein [Rhizobium halophilum]MCF6370860.1 EAL domain-containing protein [Rhizobium halophilum]